LTVAMWGIVGVVAVTNRGQFKMSTVGRNR
jgi:hypothetical protein